MKHGSLFSGIGGFDYAASIMGWENVFHCEWNTFGQQVLKYHFPNSICHDDITKTDFSIYRGRIDIISGGFPCQPYSMAGKRLGKDDERHLWPEMLRVIREVSPKWIVGENVFGIVNWSGGLVFEEVQADLEREGYEVQSYILPAAGVDAPHKRDRVWFVAYKAKRPSKNSNEDGRRGELREEESCIGQLRNVGAGDNEWIPTDNGEVGIVTDTSHTRLQGCIKSASNSKNKNGLFGNRASRSGFRGKVTNVSEEWDASDTDHTRCEWHRTQPLAEKQEQIGPGHSYYIRENAWQNFPTQSPICFGNDGISSRLDTTAISFPKWRNESIKAAGNAVVPQVVLQIFKAIQEYENLNFC